jgi:hypothetical protein
VVIDRIIDAQMPAAEQCSKFHFLDLRLRLSVLGGDFQSLEVDSMSNPRLIAAILRLEGDGR